jgi:hypothetical protein
MNSLVSLVKRFNDKRSMAPRNKMAKRSQAAFWAKGTPGMTACQVAVIGGKAGDWAQYRDSGKSAKAWALALVVKKCLLATHCRKQGACRDMRKI